ncbi:GNAT family N-acetyltransferase [Chelatococcus sp. SYSU_G07232]|uniref:GNAT family N-acetyltransferase n=1 Tax=Chelatococcus albus TaxID=3047466 RepID=A0ABT7AI05_9HYPH|nr:GNAT family N-acetyltransferase [Chelatococcus sp. SYSU_G07232]MDJ1159016.1 GNAT family N-acetyltransferase [Chelatococcus sp. SYSU_G07232]
MAAATGPAGEAPRIETERLVLRGHEARDFEAVTALWGNPAVVAHIGGKPSTREESWARMLRYAGLWRLLGYGYWAVEEKGTGRFVGDVGFADFKRAITPSLEGTPEIGWVLAPAVHGRGYATEAVQGALGWSERHLAAPATACIVAPANRASLRVAQKCGYREIARTTYKESEVVMLRRERAGMGGAAPGSTPRCG